MKLDQKTGVALSGAELRVARAYLRWGEILLFGIAVFQVWGARFRSTWREGVSGALEGLLGERVPEPEPEPMTWLLWVLAFVAVVALRVWADHVESARLADEWFVRDMKSHDEKLAKVFNEDR